LQDDPYPVYARLRAEEPLHHNAEHDFWVLSRLISFGGGRHFYVDATSAVQVHSTNVRGFANLPVALDMRAA
jgi:hypothetical protein